MRRLWAHVLIAFTCIVAVFAAFPSLAKEIKSGGDYSTRRQFTFQLKEKKQEEEVIKYLDDDSAKTMAAVMEERLIASEVTSYEISIEGNDIINVAFSATNETKYRQITTYLGFSGSFALMNTDPDSEPIPASEFINGEVYKISDINQYPTIVIPVNTESEAYKNIIDWARKDENQVESEADEEGNTTKSAPLYILYNFVEGDTYKSLTETERINDKILISLDALTDSTLYYNDDHNSFAQVCGYSDANSNGYADADEVAAAYDQANFLYNLFHASALDYEVTVIKGFDDNTKVWKDANVESIVYHGELQFNGTLRAVVAAIVVISLLLVVFYRLGALSVATTSLVSSFLTLLFMVLAGMEYNVLAVVAIALVASLSLISGVIYFSKLKDEAYRGRTLKKANSEAARKSTLPIIDIHVVAILIGLMVYLLGGNAIHTFASLLILGSLAGVIINTLGLRGLAWLATNTTAFTGKFHLFAIDEDKIPNHMADEKQTYFGPYQDKDVSKNRKPIAIAALVLFVLSFVGVIVMGSLNNGYLLRSPSISTAGNEIYVVDTIRVISDEESNMNEDAVREMFADIKLYETAGETVEFNDQDTHATLESYVTKIESFVTSSTENIKDTTYNYSHYYFVVKLNSQLDGDKLYAKVNPAFYAASREYTLNELFEDYFGEINNDYDTSASCTVQLKVINTYSNKQLTEWSGIALGTFIAILVSTLYLLVRYRLSRGLASLLFPVVISTITLGFTLLPGLLGLSMPSEIYVLIPFTAFLSYVFMILVANKERDLIADDKTRDSSYEHRVEISNKALSIAYTAILCVSGLLVFIPIALFGFGPLGYSYLHLALMLGLGLSLLVVSATYIPLSNLLYKWFSKIDFSAIKPRKTKKNTKVKTKSAEPEEAVFIGIND